MTKEDGSDLNYRIQELFEFLDTKIRPEDTPAWLRKFPYVNGQLFTEQHTNVVF
nr:type IIL restriction-modification enzyme MmeI [Ligilactobacillus salivarius]